MIRTSFLTRPAYALALGLATVAGAGLIASPAMAEDKKDKKKKDEKQAKLAPSKAFTPVYIATRDTIDKAGKRPDVVAAKANVTTAETAYRAAQGRSAREAAKAAYDKSVADLGNLLVAEKAVVADAFTKVQIEDDRLFAGQFALDLGNIALDKALQRQGLDAMLASGKLPAANVPKYYYFVGGLAYDLKDYAGAATALQSAIANGYTDPSAKTLLAEAQYNGGQRTEGLTTLRALVLETKAAGQPVPAEWLDRGVQMAYSAKLSAESMEWATLRLDSYPGEFNWISAAQIVREKANYGSNDAIDVSRLLDRAGALRSNTQSAQREYIEYLQSAVGKAGVLFPGEVVKVVNQGLAVKALDGSDPFVKDALAEAQRRVAPDKATLPGLEKDARAANATAKTAMIAADTFLSYDINDKAADLYTIALAKPGVDAAAANLRLGIALLAQGKSAEAQAAFAKVDGPRAPLAKLWAVLAAGKAVNGA